MTEEEWLNADRAIPLLGAAKTLSTERKYRLFACAWARHLFPPDVHPDIRRGIEVAEQIADGTASQAAVARARAFFGPVAYISDYMARGIFDEESMFLAGVVREALKPQAHRSRVIAYFSDYEADRGLENQSYYVPQARDIFGNPFRPVDFAPWRTDTAVALAHQMYEGREFSAMPILADALQDAECANEDVLNHCRDANQTHVRGCWVIDGVLGKESGARGSIIDSHEPESP
jgi:hypothetical protein